MDFSNIWFYTLSTISQSMASIIGLFAVFAIFKIGRANEEISNIKDNTYNTIIQWGTIDSYMPRGQKDVLTLPDQEYLELLESSSSGGSISLNCIRLKKVLSEKKDILSKTNKSLYSGGLSILTSVAGLAFSSIISLNCYLMSIILLIIFGIFAVSLYFIISNIINIQNL